MGFFEVAAYLMMLAIVSWVITSIVYILFGLNEVECENCGLKMKQSELKQLASRIETRQFADHGGTDIYYYLADARVYTCSKCGKDFGVMKISGSSHYY